MSVAGELRALVVTSISAPKGAVMPVLAALEVTDMQVRAIDVGRAGTRDSGTLDKVLRAVAGELAERRLLHEIQVNPPDVVLTFDPVTTTALCLVRDESPRPAPVVAVVGELVPDSTWGATDADRYLALDDEAAVGLMEHGVDGDRILTVGPVCERAFAEAATQTRAELRQRFRIGDGSVVLIEVAGLGYELSSQIALQLSLIQRRPTFLFDAGNDADAAMALRAQVPTLDMRAKLFGVTEDAPLFWRCADVVIARPTDTAVARALVMGASMISLLPEDSAATELAKALETRGLGTTATSALLISSALEPLLGRKPAESKGDDRVAADGAQNIADAAWIVANERREVLDERQAAARASTRSRVEQAANAAEAAARMAKAAGGLEDLGGDDGGDGFAGPSGTAGAAAGAPDAGELAALRAEVSARMAQVQKTVAEAQKGAADWDRRAEAAKKDGKDELARKAEQAADSERARMHAALAEMAGLQSELSRLEGAAKQAPPRSSRTSSSGSSGSSGRPSSPPPPGASARGTRGTNDAPRAGARPGGGAAGSGSSGKSLDEMLGEMRQKTEAQKTTIDDELAALKQKMRNKT